MELREDLGAHEARLAMATVGALGGLAMWLLVRAAEHDLLGEHVTLILAAGLATFFSGVLAMAGTIGMRPALVRAAGLGAAIAALIALSMLRWPDADGFFNTPMPFLAAFAVAVLPVPFLLAAAGPGGTWRDYPALFDLSWGIVVRGIVAMVFTGVVWGVIYLSDAVLDLVGIRVISQLLSIEAVPFLLTGGFFGLAVGVVNELSAQISPRLVLRLLRLLAPVVFVVAAIFSGAVVIVGFGQAFAGLSPALMLLTMAALGITLVTVVLDATQAEASASPVLVWSARGMAVLVPVLAALAGWALWLRVADHGWTPERLFLAVLVALALAYGLAYAGAVARGRGWQGRIRAANPWMALVVIAVAALWLTPVLDAERISARNQVARYDRGILTEKALDPWVISGWGRAGEAALADIRALAVARGDTAMVAVLDDPYKHTTEAPENPALRAEVAAMLPVQPASATGTRDMMLELMQDYELQSIKDACARVTDGHKGCVMVVADLVPDLPGEEAVLALDLGGWVSIEGLYMGDWDYIQRREVRTVGGSGAYDGQGLARIAEWQAAPPPLAPSSIMQLGTGKDGLVFLP